MINLAGIDPAHAEAAISSELHLAEIPREWPLERGKLNPEVHVLAFGKLYNWRFRRAWYYWSASTDEGKGIPLPAALELYESAEGKKSVRAGGHCGCLSPLEYGATYLSKDGRVLAHVSEREQLEQLVAKGTIPKEKLESFAWTDSPKLSYHHATVDLYHIDTQEGLLLFADTVRSIGAGDASP